MTGLLRYFNVIVNLWSYVITHRLYIAYGGYGDELIKWNECWSDWVFIAHDGEVFAVNCVVYRLF